MLVGNNRILFSLGVFIKFLRFNFFFLQNINVSTIPCLKSCKHFAFSECKLFFLGFQVQHFLLNYYIYLLNREVLNKIYSLRNPLNKLNCVQLM